MSEWKSAATTPPPNDTEVSISPERARLLRQYVEERIKDANAVAALSSEAYWLRPGFPSKERVDRWNREYLDLVNRERGRREPVDL